MAGISLDSFQARRDPAPLWRYIITLPDLYQQPADIITPPPVYVEKATIPNGEGYDVEQENFANRPYPFPTLGIPNQFNIDFGENDVYMIAKYFDYWETLVFDDDGNLGLPVNYCRDIVAVLLDMTGRPSRKITLWRSFPTNTEQFGLDGSSSQPVHVVVPFVCYRVKTENLLTAAA